MGLYTNDLPDNIQSNVRLFADALQCTWQPKDIIQNDLNILKEWENAWNMELNPPKCQVLTISRSQKQVHYARTSH